MTTQLILQQGHEGQEVLRLQRAINAQDDTCGIDDLTEDGIYGPRTEEAVYRLQVYHRDIEDGRAGWSTQQYLETEIWPGLDVSGWQREMDWARIDPGASIFCWVKATEGRTMKSKPFDHNYEKAKLSGTRVGAYHFARPDNNTPEQEFENFFRVYTPMPGDLVPAIDLEASKAAKKPKVIRDWFCELAARFEDEVGQPPVIYTAKWFVDGWLGGDPGELTKCPLWVASYPKTEDRKQWVDWPEDSHVCGPKSLLGWDEWAVWQWTGKGAVSGYTGAIDRNWLCGGIAGLDALTL